MFLGILLGGTAYNIKNATQGSHNGVYLVTKFVQALTKSTNAYDGLEDVAHATRRMEKNVRHIQ